MSKELVISAASHERRVAILEEGQLVEIYIDAKKSSRWSVVSTRAGLRGCFRACSRPSWTSGWTATPSCTSATYSKI